MRNFLLSVDGGGTKTEFCISSRDGTLKDSVVVGCSNYKSVGIDNVYASFREGLGLLENRGIYIHDIAYSVWGISGCDSDHDYQLIRDILNSLGVPEERSHLCNDGVLAFYAQAYEPGIVVIAGTGSIVLGIDKEGKRERAGGWGYNISDVGSGYWIGVEALKASLLYCDGCRPWVSFFEQVKKHFSCDSFRELPYIITEVTDFYEIAKLAELVVTEAEAGDEICLGILKQGADMLAELAGSVYRRLGLEDCGRVSIVCSGGVMKNHTYQQLLKEGIGRLIPLEQLSFSTQKHAPSYGGIKLAAKMCPQEENTDE